MTKMNTEGLMKKIDALEPLMRVPEQMQHLTEKIEQISTATTSQPAKKASAAELNQLLTKLTDQQQTNKSINDRLKHLHDTIEDLPEQISSKLKRSTKDDERSTNNLRQVPLSQPVSQDSNHSTGTNDGEKANLMTNLLTLQTALQNSKQVPMSDMQQYLKRLEQSAIVRNDRDLQEVEFPSRISQNYEDKYFS